MEKNVNDLLEEYKSLLKSGEFNKQLKSGKITVEKMVKRFAEIGVDESTAKILLSKIMKEHKFNQIQKLEKQRLRTLLSLGLMVFVVTAVSIFDFPQIPWSVIAIIIAGCLGYFGFSDKPFAGIIGGLTFAALYPITYNLYFVDRISYLRIELFIPLLMAAIPSLLIYYVISYFVYRNSEI